MFTRAELEFKSRACVAQTKLRVVAFSIALVVPAWIGFWALQQLHLNVNLGIPIRSGAALLLFIYVVGVFRIIRRTERDHGLICPNCRGGLGLELKNVTREGACKHCGAKIIR